MLLARTLGRSDIGVISFTVHEPPHPPVDQLDRAECLVFVKEGFTYSAAAFAPIWLLFKQQWLAFIAYVAALGTIVLAFAVFDGSAAAIPLVTGALNLLVGFEADAIQRFTLARRGYQMIGTVSGRSESECERRFLASWLPQQQSFSPTGGAGQAGTLAAASDAFDGRLEGRRGWLGKMLGGRD